MIKNEISKILDAQDFGYIAFYKDYNEVENYKERGSYFYGLDIPQALIKTTENALKHGLTSENIIEYLEGSSAWSVLTEEDKIKILNHFNAQNTEANDSKEANKYISYPLSESIDICYDESQKEFFTISPFSKNPRKEHILKIPIKFKGIIIDDNNNKFINATINGNSNYYSLDDFKSEIKKFAVTGAHLEKIMQFLLSYINDENNIKNAKIVHPDNIYIENKIIKVSDTYNIDKIKTIKTIFKLYKISTSPDNLITNLVYFISATLSYFFRSDGKLFPYLINAGVPGSGKTTIPVLFAVKGYNQLDSEAHLIMNDVKTNYTLMKSLSRSILPTIQEETTNSWIQFQSELLKAMADSIHAGSRGYLNTVKHSEARSQLSMDSNDFIDAKLAEADRFIVCSYPKETREKQNIKQFNEISSELPDGFMFSLFDAVFGGKNIDDVIKRIYSVKNRNEIKKSLIKYVLDKLNSITPDVHFDMPDFDTFKTEKNLLDWPAELYNNLDYIYRQISNGEKIGTYNLNKSQLARNDKKIYITRTGFSILQKALNLPFKSIDEFDNNTMSANFKTSITTFRFSDSIYPQHCLLISPIESNDPPEIRKLKNEIARLAEIKKELKDQNIQTESIDQIINELNKKIDELSQKESPNENPDPPKDPLDNNKNNDDENKKSEAPDNDNKALDTFKTEKNLLDWPAELYNNLDYIYGQISNGENKKKN